MDDQTLGQFCQFTNTEDLNVAEHYLESAGGDLNRAVSLYFDHSHTTDQCTSTTSPASRSRRVHSPEVDEDGVRAPLAQFDEQLMTSSHLLQANFTEMRTPTHADPLAGILPQIPNDLQFQGPFIIARDVACERKRFVFVNIQNGSLQAMDLHRALCQDLIVDIIRSNFVFWQRDCKSNEGADFVRLYKVDKIPYIGVVCPRTGFQLRTWEVERFNQQSDALLDDFLRTVVQRVANTPPNQSVSMTSSSSDAQIEFESQVNPTTVEEPSGYTLGGAGTSSSTEYQSTNQMLAGLHQERQRRAKMQNKS